MGAVAEVVGGGAGVGEVGRGHHLAAGQVGVGGVDAGVEHGHLDALAGQAGRPGGRAPIWVRLGSRSVARKRRSSHTRVTPASLPVVPLPLVPLWARAAPSLAAATRGWRMAVARRLVSSR